MGESNTQVMNSYALKSALLAVFLASSACNQPVQVGEIDPSMIRQHDNALIGIFEGPDGLVAHAVVLDPQWGGGQARGLVPDGTCGDGPQITWLDGADNSASVGRSVGEQITVSSGASTVRLARVLGNGQTAPPVSYLYTETDRTLPGPVVHVSWAGDPAGTKAIADSFDGDAIEMPEAPSSPAVTAQRDQPLRLSWGGASADMLVVDFVPKSTTPARLITCLLADNGATTIPANTITQLGNGDWYDRVQLTRFKHKRTQWVEEQNPYCATGSPDCRYDRYQVVGLGARRISVPFEIVQ